MIRLFVIDDHPAVADGIRYNLRPSRCGIKVIGSSLDLGSALHYIVPSNIDIFILDLYLPGDEDPIKNVRALKRKWPEKKIIIYTMEKNPLWMRAMFKEGVDGYVTKDFEGKELITAIHNISEGGRYFPDYVSLDQKMSLSEEQSIIINLLGDDYTIEQIAGILHLKYFNIYRLLQTAKKQFHVRSTCALIAKKFRKVIEMK
jgi:DNA-binding NarL/FixJ family response regulator